MNKICDKEDLLFNSKTNNYYVSNDKDSVLKLEKELSVLNKSKTNNSYKYYKDMSYINLFKQINYLKYTNLFKKVSEPSLIKIVNAMKVVYYEPNEIIINEGSEADKFYLIQKGSVNIYTKINSNDCNKVNFNLDNFAKEYNFHYLRTLEEGNYFGEIGLLDEFNNNNKRTATVIAATKLKCFVIEKHDFNNIITGELRQYLKYKINYINSNIDFNNLYFCKYLDSGKYGNVCLVLHNNFIYALKCVMNIDKFYRSNTLNKFPLYKDNLKLNKYILNEREILLRIDHPFIVKLIKTFRDGIDMYFLLEYINGITISKYIFEYKEYTDNYLKDNYLLSNIFKKKNYLFNISTNIYDIQFYLSSLVIIIEYLNKKNIIHRDIKPDNLMINSNGYLKIIDFGISKKLKDYSDTVVGTPHYMAPEIIDGKGYSLTADYWSIGVCLYQLLYNAYPYGNNVNDIIDIYKDIKYEKIKYINNQNYSFKDNNNINLNDVNDVIIGLLNKNIPKRLQYFSNIKSSALLKDINFVSKLKYLR